MATAGALGVNISKLSRLEIQDRPVPRFEAVYQRLVKKLANRPRSQSNFAGRVHFTVRLTPQFLKRICGRLQSPAPSAVSLAGLLFGRTELDGTEILAYRSLPESAGPGLLEIEPAIIEDLISAARSDPETAHLQLAGWYAFRSKSGLDESDFAFHNQYFRRPNEIALIVRPEQSTYISCDLYSRSGTAPLSEQIHRWGSWRLATGTLVAGPVDISLQAKIAGNAHVRAFHMSQPLDPAPERKPWSAAIETVKSAIASLSQAGKTVITRRIARIPPQREERIPIARAAAAGSSAPLFASPTIPAPASHSFIDSASGRTAAPSNLPQKPSWASAIRKSRQAALWICVIALAIVAAAATSALVYQLEFAADANVPAFLRFIFPDRGLALRAEAKGDRLLIRWNRANPIVRSAGRATLRIDDGSQHRNVSLDPAQVASGAVLYHPASGDVGFQLEVYGKKGALISGSTRVLDAGQTPPQEARNVAPAVISPKPVPNSQTPAAALAVVKRLEPSAPPPITVLQNISAENSRPPKPASQPVLVAKTASVPQPQLREKKAAAPSELPSNPPQTQTAADTTPQPSIAPAPATPAPDPLQTPILKQESAQKAAEPVSIPNGVSANPAPPVYVPPRPVKQAVPDLTLFLKSVISQATSRIDVVVKVDESGRVTEAHLAGDARKIPMPLALATLNAARKWTFQPATINGKNVASDHLITFKFHPSGE